MARTSLAANYGISRLSIRVRTLYGMVMAQALWMRLREEHWNEYAVSRGSAERLPKILQDLASRKRARSMKACHEVWSMLCRNGIHSAAVITVPYLVEILDISIEDVQIEIADTLKCCAMGASKVDADWQVRLVSSLRSVVPEVERLAQRAPSDVRNQLNDFLGAMGLFK